MHKKINGLLLGLSEHKRAALAYIIANLFNKGLGVLTFPLFTRLLSTSEMGMYTNYTSWLNIIYPVATLSLTSGSINVAMVKYKTNRKEYLSSCLGISTISVVVVFFFALVYRGIITTYTKLDSSLIVLLGAYCLVNPALDLWYAKQRYELKYKSVMIVSIATVLVSTAASIIAIIIAPVNENAAFTRICAQYFVLIAVGAAFFVNIIIRGKCIHNRSMWIFALKISVPLIFHTLAKNVLDMSDRIMISNMCGDSETGIYGTVYIISTMALIVWSAINASLIPQMFENLSNNKIEETKTLSNNVLVLFGFASVLMTLFGPEILRLLTSDDYYEAVYIIPAIAGGVYLTALYNIFGNLLLYKKKSINIMVATIISAVINIGLNYLFINLYGYKAAAYTTLASFIILSLLQGLMVKRIYEPGIVSFKKLFALSSIFVLLNLSCIFLYRVHIVRYIFIVLIIAFVSLNYKRIRNLIFK